jgi:hypothetical protein
MLDACQAATLTLCLPIKMAGVKPAGAMKTPSGTFALKLVILAAGVSASIVLISACWKAAILAGAHPILMIMDKDGVKVRASSEVVQKAFDDLIQKRGKDVCDIDYYDEHQQKKWHRPLTMTGAVRSKAAENPPPADPMHLLQKVAFADLDESQQFFSEINPTPTPTPAP